MGLHLSAKSAISCVLIAGVAIVHATKYEAEELAGVAASDILTGDDFSGGKYVKPATEGLTFTYNAEETGMYSVTANVLIKQYDWFESKIYVNGAEAGSMLTKPRECDSSYVIKGSAKMKAGENTINVGEKAIGVDYIIVERIPDPEFKISAMPVTPNATESAMKVKTFLRDNFLKKTISGMMISDQNFNYDYGNMKLLSADECTPEDSCKFLNGEDKWKGQTDIAEFYKRSGHYPAVGGFDFIFATGGHSDEGWFRGYTDNHVAMAKELWDLGGIPTFTWHWKVGQDTAFYSKQDGYKNAGCTEGVASLGSDNTCFDYRKAFKDSTCKEINPASDEYKNIMEDIDKVSSHLKILEDQGVAVLWRPLHEASGGWFWWGLSGPECYVQLYRLVFERMVGTNKLKNLIWVWNINTDPAYGYDYAALNGAWYPGDEYVDIVAVDIYDALLNHNSAASYWNKIIDEVGTNKMIALSENGAIPDIDSIAEDKSYWSYWMTWSQTWSNNFLDKTTNDMWKRNLDDDRIIALDDMPGWSAVVADTSKDGAIIATNAIRNAPMVFANNITISAAGKTVSLFVPQDVHGTVALFDMTGHRVANLAQGNLKAGSHRIDLQAMATGSYVVRATAGKYSTSRVIKLK